MSLINQIDKPHQYTTITPGILEDILFEMGRINYKSPQRNYTIFTGEMGMWGFEFTMLGIGQFNCKIYVTEFSIKGKRLIYISLFEKHGKWKVKIINGKPCLYEGTNFIQSFRTASSLLKYLNK